MRQKSFVLFLLFSLFSVAQSTKIESIGSFRFNNFGSLQSNSDHSYYAFYEANDLGKDKSFTGLLTFFDQDLKIIKTEKFPLNKKNKFFLEARNNHKNAMVGLYDSDTEIAKFTIYNSGGEIINTKEISLNKNSFNPEFYKIFETIGDFNLLFPVKNKGFLITENTTKKRIGYNLHYVGEKESDNWTYGSAADANNRKTVCPMYADSEKIILMEKEWGSVYDKQPTFTAIVLDAFNGKELFKVSHPFETTPNFYTHASVNTNGEILLFGETYKTGNNYPDNDYNTGYFIEKYSNDGQLISKNEFQFENTLYKSKLGINAEEKQKNYGTIFFHELITIGNKTYAIGEKAVRTKQGFTIANAILSASIGGGVGGLISNNWQTKYTIENMAIFEIDENLELKQCHPLLKEKNFTGLNTMVVRPYFNYKEMNMENKLDYLFSDTSTSAPWNLYYLDRKVKDTKMVFTLKKSNKTETAFDTVEISNLELNNNEKLFQLKPVDNHKMLLLKYDGGDNSIGVSFIQLQNK